MFLSFLNTCPSVRSLRPTGKSVGGKSRRALLFSPRRPMSLITTQTEKLTSQGAKPYAEQVGIIHYSDTVVMQRDSLATTNRFKRQLVVFYPPDKYKYMTRINTKKLERILYLFELDKMSM